MLGYDMAHLSVHTRHK